MLSFVEINNLRCTINKAQFVIFYTKNLKFHLFFYSLTVVYYNKRMILFKYQCDQYKRDYNYCMDNIRTLLR